MKTAEKEPGLIEDLGSVVGLYKQVFWMVGKRVRYGKDWEERLADETMSLFLHESENGASRPQPRHN
jgi:hypothetical protein